MQKRKEKKGSSRSRDTVEWMLITAHLCTRSRSAGQETGFQAGPARPLWLGDLLGVAECHFLSITISIKPAVCSIRFPPSFVPHLNVLPPQPPVLIVGKLDVLSGPLKERYNDDLLFSRLRRFLIRGGKSSSSPRASFSRLASFCSPMFGFCCTFLSFFRSFFFQKRNKSSKRNQMSPSRSEGNHGRCFPSLK